MVLCLAHLSNKPGAEKIHEKEDAKIVCTKMHETCKKFISKKAKYPLTGVLKICDIYADEVVAPLDHLLQEKIAHC